MLCYNQIRLNASVLVDHQSLNILRLSGVWVVDLVEHCMIILVCVDKTVWIWLWCGWKIVKCDRKTLISINHVSSDTKIVNNLDAGIHMWEKSKVKGSNYSCTILSDQYHVEWDDWMNYNGNRTISLLWSMCTSIQPS